jgi:CheY-like chemotaxis protein
MVATTRPVLPSVLSSSPAADGGEALALFGLHADSIRLVVTDMMMPRMSGIALVRALRRQNASPPVLATSGLNEPAQVEEMAPLKVP